LVQSFILGSVVACMLILAIGNNLVGAIGSMGFMAMIRFRSNLRDPRDMVFVFAALGTGVTAGLQAYRVAAIGSIAFCLTAVVLWWFGIGARRTHDGLLRFQANTANALTDSIAAVMQRHTKTFALVTMREVAQGQMMDYSYQVKMSGSQSGAEQKLIEELGSITGLSGIVFMSQQPTVEV
jgi:hypothetical protein